MAGAAKSPPAIAGVFESHQASDQAQRDQAEAISILKRLAWQRRDTGNVALVCSGWPDRERTLIEAVAAALGQAECQPTLLARPFRMGLLRAGAA